jgi:hypothetical protein
MKTKLFLFFIVLTLKANSQNLVPNGSFEDYYNCGDGWYQITNAVGWKEMQTPDYFHTCVVPTGIINTDVPDNFHGNQLPVHGNAYAGLAAYYSYNFRELIQIRLSQNLSNTYYCVNFKVSLADTSRWAVNKIGAHFSPDTLYPQPYQSIPTSPWSIFTYYIPQIESDTFLNDTSSWALISGVFQANGNEEYITIGNFRDDAGTDTVRMPGSSGAPISYYYIDEVSVEEVLAANAGTDTSIVSGDSVQLGNNPTENAAYVWQPAAGLSDISSANPMAFPSSTTTYTVTKTQCDVITMDTVIVYASVNIKENNRANKIKLFPNPNNGNITVEYDLKDNETGKLFIYDLIGRLVFSYDLTAVNSSDIHTELREGTYLYEVVINGQSIKKDKLIILD